MVSISLPKPTVGLKVLSYENLFIKTIKS
jgi:hypothetical protein